MEILPPQTKVAELLTSDSGSGAARLQDLLRRAAGVQAEDPALARASREFEAYFIAHLLQTMRKTVPEGLIPNKGGEFFRSLYDQEIGRLAAEAGAFGLAAYLQEHLAEFSLRPPLKEGLKSYATRSDTEAEVTSPVPGHGRGTIGREE